MAGIDDMAEDPGQLLDVSPMELWGNLNVSMIMQFLWTA